MPKPDDRSDNVDKLQHLIHDTMENMEEARDFVKAHGEEMRADDKAEIQAKNERRERAIGGFREEIKDEIDDGY